jgi:hypothetical protein
MTKGTLKANPPPGRPVSVDGRTRVDEFCGHCSAPLMMRDGHPTGVYIDDTTPDRRKWIGVALEHHPPPEIVFVGIGPDEHRDTLEDESIGVPHVDSSHLIRLQEWLGWGNAYGPGEPILPWRDFLPVRDCKPGNGYILQLRWHGYYGHHSPNKTCWETQLRQARKHKPRFIFHV